MLLRLLHMESTMIFSTMCVTCTFLAEEAQDMPGTIF